MRERERVCVSVCMCVKERQLWRRVERAEEDREEQGNQTECDQESVIKEERECVCV